MSNEPSPSAVEHAFSEIRKLYHDAAKRPTRHPALNMRRGIDHYGPFELISVLARGAELFRRAHRYWPSLEHPRCFSEHIFRYKYLGEFPIPSVADKLAVRDRVAARTSAALLTPILWQGTDLRAAATLDLPPGQYYLKANHGSGLNHRLRFPGAFADDFETLVKKTQGWLNWEWGRQHGEWQYNCFKRRLFIEQFIAFSGPDQTPDDYKFYCFDGKVRMIHVDIDRFTGHRQALLTPDWQFLPVRVSYPAHQPARPACLAEMIAIAEKLAAGIRFVRVDLYSDSVSQIRFGEMTLVPFNAVEPFSDPDFDVALGQYFNPDAAAQDPIGAWLRRRS